MWFVSPDETVEVVRSAFLAINRGDDDAFLDVLHHDVEWDSAADGIVAARRLRGRDAVRASRRDAAAEGRHVRTTLQEIEADGDRVLVFGVVTTDVEHRGRLTLPMAWIWSFADGSVRRVESFTNRSAALHAWHGD